MKLNPERSLEAPPIVHDDCGSFRVENAPVNRGAGKIITCLLSSFLAVEPLPKLSTSDIRSPGR